MKNSQMLYRHPGQYEIEGEKFDYVIVDESEIEAYLLRGWSKTTAEAKESDKVAKAKRFALEEEATRNGVKFDGRTSDAKLEAAVAEAKSQTAPLW